MQGSACKELLVNLAVDVARMCKLYFARQCIEELTFCSARIIVKRKFILIPQRRGQV